MTAPSPSRRGSLNVDDEGTPTQRTVLIENGRLVGYIQDKLNARLMGMQPTGNGRRQSFAHLPMPRMTNTYMLPGPHAPEEIIASVDKGIYARNFGGGQVDITSGKFVFSASEAYLIEKGRLGAPIRDATLVGDGPSVLRKVSMVGTDLRLDEGVGTCGKEGQSVPVGVGQPTLRIDGLTVGRHAPADQEVARVGLREHVGSLLRPVGVERGANALITEREDRRGEQRGIDRASLADRQRAHRDSGRHLHDRQQGVHAAQRGRGQRHAQHRQRRLRRGHAGQRRGQPGAGDQHLEAAVPGRLAVFGEPIRRPVGRDRVDLVGDAERVEGRRCVRHQFPVRVGAHQDADQWFHAIVFRRFQWFDAGSPALMIPLAPAGARDGPLLECRAIIGGHLRP